MSRDDVDVLSSHGRALSSNGENDLSIDHRCCPFALSDTNLMYHLGLACFYVSRRRIEQRRITMGRQMTTAAYRK